MSNKKKVNGSKVRETALCIYDMFALGPLIPYMLQYTLLFICGDVDVSHELAGFVCVCMREGGREGEKKKGKISHPHNIELSKLKCTYGLKRKQG